MSKKILIVDDEKNIRMMLKHCLKERKYNTDIAINGDEALNKIKENNYDLVLLDIKMPGLSGMDVLKKVRERGNNVNIIMMTAYGTIERAVEAMKLNAIDFLSKPFTTDEIRSIVSDVFSREELIEEDLENYKDIIEFSKKCFPTSFFKLSSNSLENKGLSPSEKFTIFCPAFVSIIYPINFVVLGVKRAFAVAKLSPT
ncbi:MAG: sigma-54-dependent Fis family transcriptional regulator [Tissierellales bacterium]|nr:sigma-54-dependent Fis family transcriptional regulator [Tissierellales bacterium]